MSKPAVALCLLLLSGFSMAFDGLQDDDEVRSKPDFTGNSFVAELFLKYDDEPHYSLNLASHFPAAGQLLDINSGWHIYLLNEPVTGSSGNVPTMRLLFQGTDESEPQVSINMQALPLGASNALQRLVQKFWPQKAGYFQFNLQVTGHEVTVDSSKNRQYEAARYIASDGDKAARLQLYLPPVRQASHQPNLPAHPKPQKSSFRERPHKWVEVTVLNDREDVEKERGWFSVSPARLGMDRIDVEHGPVSESEVPAPGHNLGHVSMLSSTYDVEFNDQQPSGEVYQHSASIHPHTAIRARQSGLIGRIRDGILTLVIHRYRQINFYNKEGQYTSRRQSSIEQRFIQIHYRRGRIGELTSSPP